MAALDALYQPGGAAVRAQLLADQPNLIAALRRAARSGDGATAARSALGVLAMMRTSGPLRAQEARLIASSLGVTEGAELVEMLRALDARLSATRPDGESR